MRKAIVDRFLRTYKNKTPQEMMEIFKKEGLIEKRKGKGGYKKVLRSLKAKDRGKR